MRAVEDTARLLADLGHDVFEIDPHYPDPTLAFVPQFFAGIRTESDAVEHYDRLERRTRQTYRMGTWVTPRVIDWALAPDREGLREGEPGLRLLRRAAHPDHRAPPAAGRDPRRQRHGRLRAGARCRPSRTSPSGTSPATRPRPCRAGPAADGLPTAVQLVGRTDDETTLLSLSAQIEQRPSLAAGGRRLGSTIVSAIEVAGPRDGLRGAQGSRRGELRGGRRASSSGSSGPTVPARPPPWR